MDGVASTASKKPATTTVLPGLLMAQSPESTPDPLLPETIVPNEERRFASRDEAEEFFNFYAGAAGFDVRITKTRKTLRELSCNKQGHHEFYKPDGERVREKMSGRCECKAFVKVKWNRKKDYWFFERIRLEHTHPLNPSPSVKQFLRTQKNKDPVVMEIVDQMHRCDASHNTTVNVLSVIFRGRQNFTFTEMDLKNSSMAAAIKKVFKKTQHRLCRWHMLKKYKAELKKLYKLHDGLKIKLLTVINHPLTPTEFESAWNELVDEYGIREDDTIKGLWDSRKLWVAAYLKPLYCGRMTSTQRSESVNQMIKSSGFTGHMTCMSKFARRMLDFIQHTNHTAAGETHWSQAGNLQLTLQPFDGHLSRRGLAKSFDLVFACLRLYGKSSNDLVNLFSTGLFCAHLVKAFTYLQLDNIPSDYIMKRYTRGARSVVMWDRHDIVTTELGCESDQYKTRKLVQIAMAAVRACRKTSIGFGRGCEQLTALAEWAETIAADTGPSNVGDCASAQDMTCQTGSEDPGDNRIEQDVVNGSKDEPRAPPVTDEVQISGCAPKEARTKGRKRGGKQVVDDPSGSKEQGKRTCGYCGMLGHYSTGCALNPENESKKRGASGSLRGKMGRKRGRPPTARQLEEDFDDVA
ncbi:unnamed protein product [Urochloa decumbens]|uniref:Protein FAR1-RELATED SEQUENCE n=1 Tax=Urochloa decumbens TaxID=240449 RepID=A0ABC9B6T0_9POAL